MEQNLESPPKEILPELEQQKQANRKRKITIAILAFWVVIAIIVVTISFVNYVKSSKLLTTNISTSKSLENITQAKAATSTGWRTVTLAKYGISIDLPPELGLMPEENALASAVNLYIINPSIKNNDSEIDIRTRFISQIIISTTTETIDNLIKEDVFYKKNYSGKIVDELNVVKIENIDGVKGYYLDYGDSNDEDCDFTKNYLTNGVLYNIDGCPSDFYEPNLDRIRSSVRFFNPISDKRTSADNVNFNDLYYKNGKKCDFQFNQEKPNILIPFTDSKNEMSFLIPYNLNWGNDKYFVPPFDIWNRRNPDLFGFGNANLSSGEGGCHTSRDWNFDVIPKRDKNQIIKETSLVELGETTRIEDKNINGINVHEYFLEDLENGGYWGNIEIEGNKSNFKFQMAEHLDSSSMAELEEIVKTVILNEK